MKQYVSILGLFILLCSFRECKSGSESTATLYKNKWWLSTLHPAVGTEPAVRQKAFIRFDNVKNSAGGNGGCNVFGSTLILSKDKLSVSNIFSTKMFCEQFQQMEDKFLGLLGTVNRYEVKGNHLSLFKDNELLLEFDGEMLPE